MYLRLYLKLHLYIIFVYINIQKDQLNVIQSNMDIEKATIQEEIYDVAVSCIISMDDIERESNIDPRMRRKPSQGGKDYVCKKILRYMCSFGM